jgi:hypothetical protein
MFKTGKSIFLLMAIAFSVIITGCGGGGGGGSATLSPTSAIPVASSNSITASEEAREFVAQFIASRYHDLNEYNSMANFRASKSIRAYSETILGVGQYSLNYGPDDLIHDFDTNYLYTSGQLLVSIKDFSGNYTDNYSLADQVAIDYKNLQCTISGFIDQNKATIKAGYNGLLVFEGFYLGKTYSLSAQNFQINAMVNNADSIIWKINGKVSIDQLSFPYPTSGSTETGSISFNKYHYNYAISYSGTNIAQVDFSGDETFSMNINLATGVVVSVDFQNNPDDFANLSGTWRLIEEDREGVMLPVYPNNSGAVSEITFYGNGTFSYKSYERGSNSSMNYWQTKDIAPETMSGTYQFSNGNLTMTAQNMTVVHTISFENDKFRQVNQYAEVFIWQKV